MANDFERTGSPEGRAWTEPDWIEPCWIEPDWPAPPHVRAGSTTRLGGVSQGPFASLNFADHVGDDPARVAQNRTRLRHRLGLPAEPHWLQQVHGSTVVAVGDNSRRCPADAVIGSRPGEVCAVMTADCLPLLMTDRWGRQVAAVYAGWRGLAHGVIEAAVARFSVAGGDLLCWLGPAIGPGAYEVGGEVRARFIEEVGASVDNAFRPSPGGKWLADLYVLARQRLRCCGVSRIWGGDLCTYSDAERFFSYRRDGVTGRMASLIWIS